MGSGASCQCTQVVPTFERRYDAAPRAVFCHLDNLSCHPCVVTLEQTQRGHVVIPMGIETRRNKYHLRGEIPQGWQPDFLHDAAELLSAAIGFHRDVDHSVRAALRAAVRVKGVLE